MSYYEEGIVTNTTASQKLVLPALEPQPVKER